MPTKRQTRFLHAVAEAASSAKPVIRRGRPTPGNLTSEGRSIGLSAMLRAKRCRCINRSGKPCMAPAMRGSSRCLKHGGRVEVPDHPHNIKRFFEGRSPTIETHGAGGLSDEEFWEQLPYRLKKEVLDVLPREVIANGPKLFLAARVWMDVRSRDYPALQKFLRTFVRA